MAVFLWNLKRDWYDLHTFKVGGYEILKENHQEAKSQLSVLDVDFMLVKWHWHSVVTIQSVSPWSNSPYSKMFKIMMHTDTFVPMFCLNLFIIYHSFIVSSFWFIIIDLLFSKLDSICLFVCLFGWLVVCLFIYLFINYFLPYLFTILYYSRWWFQIFFLFAPRKLGKISILTSVSQMGWNHQPVFVYYDHLYLQDTRCQLFLRFWGLPGLWWCWVPWVERTPSLNHPCRCWCLAM